ncbi:TolC family protein [Pollutibacter soli]|uniref:TolC family protein n=1 Tax=Pollutibacter soli TaxID=3034157 RepID=UPI003014145F
MLIVYKKAVKPLSIFLLFAGFCIAAVELKAQETPKDSLLNEATIENVVAYALRHQPLIRQSLADEEITRMQVKAKLSEWLPQVNFNYLYQHNFQLQASIIGGNLVTFGVKNSSSLQFTASQTLFNRDVIFASKTRKDYELQAKQQTSYNKIDVAINVSKAFYDILATRKQIDVAQENITRLERSLNDARAQYEAGVVDKTDYKRAQISLNSTRAQKKANEEQLVAKMDNLRALMNYPKNGYLNLLYDSATLMKEIELDTLQMIDYTDRIEFQQLETQRRLLESNLKYNKWSYLPSLTANGSYLMNFFDNQFDKLYNRSVPNSFAGLTLSFPLFQGGKRKFNVKEAEWELRKTEYGITSLKNNMNAEYSSALAQYKNSLTYFLALKENVDLAKEVYEVVDLQYRSGIKAYIEVTVAESDLRTAQISLFDALYVVLSSKLDVLRSLGQLKY